MARLVCLTHRDYDGKDAPQLTCKNCCSIYISEIKKLQVSKSVDTQYWVESKIKSGTERPSPARGLDINPEWI